MIDGCGREIDHLRLSLTDRCNLACRYCVPKGAPPRGKMIDEGFAFELVRWLSERHGIRHIRLTGGEPLLYPSLLSLIERLSSLDSLHEITLTTNGQALTAKPHSRTSKSKALHRAGLSRVNVSLDTLDPDRFAALTGGGQIALTLAGIEAAVEAGLTPVKINVVAQRDFNDCELPAIAEWGLSRGCVVRFLEVMPIGPLAHVADRHLVPASEILERLGERFDLKPIDPSHGQAAFSVGQPSTDYAARRGGLRGVIGLIAPTTRPFCSACRRIRVTSSGLLVPCLHANRHADLFQCWNGKAAFADGRQWDAGRADALLREAILAKPAVGNESQSLTMLSLGG